MKKCLTSYHKPLFHQNRCLPKQTKRNDTVKIGNLNFSGITIPDIKVKSTHVKLGLCTVHWQHFRHFRAPKYKLWSSATISDVLNSSDMEERVTGKEMLISQNEIRCPQVHNSSKCIDFWSSCYVSYTKEMLHYFINKFFTISKWRICFFIVSNQKEMTAKIVRYLKKTKLTTFKKLFLIEFSSTNTNHVNMPL